MSNISEVKERIDIVALVSDYVQLRKAGKNYVGLCPFHSEKHGSFYVFPDRQTWHCFGACATGGDIFSFIMKKENVEFGEALRMLADRAGVQLAPKRPLEEPRDESKDRLLGLLDVASTQFRDLLLHGDSAERAREYLSERRIAFVGPTGEAFRLGYAPAGWTDSQDKLLARGYTQQAGMVENLLLAVVDTAIAAQNATLAAESLGLGCCYIGAIRNSPREVIELLDLPHLTFPLVGMTVGWPLQESMIRPRLPLEAVLHWEQYDHQNESVHLEKYDQEMIDTGIYQGRQVSAEDPLPTAQYGWTEHSARRVSLTLRPHLREVLLDMGFDMK